MSILKRLFAIDLRSLALFRVALGVILLIDLGVRATDLVAHYTDKGVLPRYALLEHLGYTDHLSLHLINGTVFWQAVLFVFAAIAALALLFGYRTRVATIVSWFLLISLHVRNPLVLQGGDILLRMLLFWAMFLPLAARYSVDAALSKKKDPASHVLSIPSAALLLQVAILYWFTAVLKTGNAWIPDGTATYFSLMIDQFTRPFGYWLLQYQSLMQWLTYGIYALEALAFPLLFFPWKTFPLRTFTIIAIVLMHVGMGLGLSLGLFPWIDMVALIPFIPSSWWERLFHSIKKRIPEGVTIYYDGDCGFCKKTVTLIREFFLFPSTTLLPSTSDGTVARLMEREHSWVVIDHTGAGHYRYDGWITLTRYSPLLFPIRRVFSLRPVVAFGEWAYHFVSSRRRHLGRFTARFFPYRDYSTRVHWFWQLVVLLALVCVVWWNIADLTKTTKHYPDSLRHVVRTVRVDQKWNMFAPYPLVDDGWYVIAGVLKDGTAVDVYNKQDGEPSYAKPDRVSLMYPNSRWRKYMMNIWRKRHAPQRLYYGKYLCRDWNTGTPLEKRLATFSIYFMKERTLADYQVAPVEKVQLWQHDCFK